MYILSLEAVRKRKLCSKTGGRRMGSWWSWKFAYLPFYPCFLHRLRSWRRIIQLHSHYRARPGKLGFQTRPLNEMVRLSESVLINVITSVWLFPYFDTCVCSFRLMIHDIRNLFMHISPSISSMSCIRR